MPLQGRPVPGGLHVLEIVQQAAGPGSFCGQCSQYLQILVRKVIVQSSRIYRSPSLFIAMTSMSFTIGILGIVPAVLSMYGHDRAANIVAAVAGAIACAIPVVQFFTVPEPVGAPGLPP
jgi:hypothetical protein